MLFSIVIPLYNKAHTISLTLMSIEKQTYRDFEVIVVNDGSTDNSLYIVNNFDCNFKVTIISQPNRGVSIARNKGIEESNGEYICFLDGDDEWESEYLSKVNEAVRQYTDSGLIITGRYYKDSISKIKTPILFESKKNRISIVDFFENPHQFVHISSTTVKRSIISNYFKNNEYFLPHQKVKEDFTFLYKLALNTSVIYIGFPLSTYKGNVIGQATSILKDQQRLFDTILYLNTVVCEWESLKKNNVEFRYFLRFEFLHILWKNLLKGKDDHLETMVKKVKYDSIFNSFEKFIIKRFRKSKYFLLIYIAVSKMIRRIKYKS